MLMYHQVLEKQGVGGVVAHERVKEPRVTIESLPSNAFIRPDDIVLKTFNSPRQ